MIQQLIRLPSSLIRNSQCISKLQNFKEHSRIASSLGIINKQNNYLQTRTMSSAAASKTHGIEKSVW